MSFRIFWFPTSKRGERFLFRIPLLLAVGLSSSLLSYLHFTNLYAIRLGHFKTFQVSPAGEQQVTGFQMAGELLGMDAISTEHHHCDAMALEDSEVCEIPFARLEELFGTIPSLLHHFHRMMSQEITREQNVMLLLGNMRAEQRFAAFLINLSSRYAARGY